jgi:hypothetical protein
MDGKSLAQYLDEVRPTTPREFTTVVFGWMQYQLAMDMNEVYQRVVKECADQIQKWMDE